MYSIKVVRGWYRFSGDTIDIDTKRESKKMQRKKRWSLLWNIGFKQCLILTIKTIILLIHQTIISRDIWKGRTKIKKLHVWNVANDLQVHSLISRNTVWYVGKHVALRKIKSIQKNGKRTKASCAELPIVEKDVKTFKDVLLQVCVIVFESRQGDILNLRRCQIGRLMVLSMH